MATEKDQREPFPHKNDGAQLEFGAAHTGTLKDESSGEELVTVEKGYTDVVADLPSEEARRILKKVDYRLVPLLSLLYLVAFIDRSNIGNAKIAGLDESFNLEGLRYVSVDRTSLDRHEAIAYATAFRGAYISVGSLRRLLTILPNILGTTQWLQCSSYHMHY